MEKLRDFISAHIVKWDAKNIIYDGELDNLNKTIDSTAAEPWSVKSEPLIEWATITLRLYGELQPIEVPIFSVTEEEVKNITSCVVEYKNIISEYMKLGILWDKRGTTLFRILEVLWVGEYQWVVCFYRHEHQELDIIKDVQPNNKVTINELELHLQVENIDDINKYENILLLYKEVCDWYYDVRKHSIVDKQQWVLVQQEYVMWRDIYAEINTTTKEVLKVEQQDTQYWAFKTEEWWMITTPDKKIINTSEFVPYKTEQKWDIIKIWMYWAYTHVLRELLKFRPITRQYKFLLWFKRLNFVAGSRRSWKCLEPNTLLRLADWWVKKAKDITLDDQLLSSDKTTATNLNAIEYYKKDIYRITLDNWMYIDVTWDHRSPTQKTFSRDWWDLNIDNYKTTLDLTTDDFIPVMYWLWLDKESTEQEYYESLLVWYMYGDWCVGTSRISVYNKDIADKIIAACNKLWYKYFYNPIDGFINIHDKNYIKSKYNWLDEYSYNKYLDPELFKLWTKAKRWLIDWLINTDGCIMLKWLWNNSDWYNRKWNILIEYCSTSERLARDYQMMLSDLWVISYIRKKKIYSQFNKTNEYSWNVFVSDLESIKKVFKNCNLFWKTNYDMCIEFLESNDTYINCNIWVIPLESFNECDVKWELINDKWNHYRLYNGIRKPRYNFQRNKIDNYWLEHWWQYARHRVKSVEFLRNDTVVDIEVDWDHTYRWNNILTHNTFLSSYLILRELRRMPDSIRHINRQIRSLYVAPSEDKFKEVIDYIRQSSERVRLLKLLEFNKKENRLSLFDEQIGRNQKTFITVATCDFSSAKWYEPGRWRASDMVVIDEAAFIPEDVRLNLLPIIGIEKAKLFAISTIDWNTNRNWFYEQLVEAEKWLTDPEHIELFGMRVTIDDVDDILVSPTLRNSMKNSLKHNKPRYYAELYASLPEVWQVFDTDWFYMINKDMMSWERSGAFIIWYDPAKRTDIWAVVVGHYKVWVDGQQYCQLIEEYELTGNYQDQKVILGNIKHKYNTYYPWCPAIVLIDATQAGDVVAELFGSIIDYRIRQTPWGKRPEVDAYGAWRVPKTHLVHLTQALIEKWEIKAWVWLKNLMNEIKNFKSIETPSGYIKYEAEVWHDDHVSAMLLISFFLWYIEWRAYGIGMEWWVVAPDGIDSRTWLYESSTRRLPIDPKEEFPFMTFWFGI